MAQEIVRPAGAKRLLTATQPPRLAAMPAEAEWFASIANRNTQRCYERALKDFMAFVGIEGVHDFHAVTRAHVSAWRQALELGGASGATIRQRLAALSSLYEWLCDANAVTHNPLKGVRRPNVESHESKTPALSDHQVRALLEAPAADTLKGRRDRAILATLLYHGLRREELCKLRVDDARQQRRGVVHLAVQGKGGKTRYLPLHPAASARIAEYLEEAGHGAEGRGALFRPVHAARAEGVDQALTPDAIYKLVRAYSAQIGCKVGVHAMRATAATNALNHQADIAKVQAWLGHANIATTKIYDRRTTKLEDSPTFQVAY